MMHYAGVPLHAVHCRTGSLESFPDTHAAFSNVHCRTGSLENWLQLIGELSAVHCRTGSLESFDNSRIE